MHGWMLFFTIVSSPYTVSGTHPVNSAEECIEIAYEKLRDFNREHGTPVRVFQALCAPDVPQPGQPNHKDRR